MVDASGELYDVILQESLDCIEFSGTVKPSVDSEELTVCVPEIPEIDDPLLHAIFSVHTIPTNNRSESGSFTPEGSRINSHILRMFREGSMSLSVSCSSLMRPNPKIDDDREQHILRQRLWIVVTDLQVGLDKRLILSRTESQFSCESRQ